MPLRTKVPVVILAVLALAPAAVCFRAVNPAGPSPGVPWEAELLQIERFEIQVLESLPAQVRLEVHGILPDGCTKLDRVTQSRAENVVTVTITTVREGEICTQVVQYVTEVVHLDGTFAPGEYVVIVNGMERRFRV